MRGDGASLELVSEILPDILAPAQGQHVEFSAIYIAYSKRCRALGKRVVTPFDFVDPLQAFCDLMDLVHRRYGSKKIFLLDVKLVEPTPANARRPEQPW